MFEFERSQNYCDILKIIKVVVFKKNCIKQPGMTKCHQNLCMSDKMLLAIHAVTFLGNRCTDRNNKISVPTMVRVLIFEYSLPRPLPLTYLDKCATYAKFCFTFFEVTSTRTILV